MKPGNVLHITSLGTDWCDKDAVMLHACFQLLCDCIEQEQLLNGHTDWDHDERHRAAKSELQALYDWWRVRRHGDHANDAAEEQYQQDDAMLARLLRVRWALWV